MATLAVFFWACESVILERKLANISPIASIAFYYLGNVALGVSGLILAKRIGVDLVMPSKEQYFLIVACGALLFCTDICYLWAFKRGG
ncbi:MAG: hypothetical protein Q8L21_01425, partial [Candidatus Komeilibacteria bacterium]|nr:hypothetical protein [Candidatus Komeilibacteria bacterium]